MALVSHKRPGGYGPGLGRPFAKRRRRGPYVAAAIVGAVVLLAGAAVVALLSANASLTTDSQALARLGLGLDGGKVVHVYAFLGPAQKPVPVEIRGDQIWPRGRVPSGRLVTVFVTIRRPGWVGWAAGHTQRLQLTLRTPTAKPTHQYVTLARGAPLRVEFGGAVAAVSYGPQAGQLVSHPLASPSTEVTVPRTGAAGSIWIAATARTWETSRPTIVSWFPTGAETAAVANPAPGTRIAPSTPIVLTFSKTVAQALGDSMPPVSPAGAGSWHQISTHAIEFKPTGYGYGIDATVRIGLPSGVELAGGQHAGGADAGTWTVPPGSTLRLQQLLATLGYLPVSFSGAATPLNPLAQEHAAVSPPSGSFSWNYRNVPSALRNMWSPGTSGVMTRGAVMAFENNQGMTADGVSGPQVWKALINAAVHGQRSTFGYTFVQVSEGSPETESTWHSGHTVASGLVNTGIPAAPTAQGVFPVFEHAPSVTMTGTNPDGSHYSDPGVPYVSYFNGGDALHGFIRGGYGYPQSLGCVEMPYSEAASVYPYTPIGTLVDVT